MSKPLKAFAALLLLACATAGGYLLLGPLLEMDRREEEGKPQLPYTEPDREKLEEIGLQPFETLLPVVHIDTQGARITRENPVSAVLAVQNEGGAPNTVPGKADETHHIRIHLRGASSYAYFDKAQYRLEFYRDEEGQKEMPHPLLGMSPHSEWVLHGPFLDRSLLRNDLAYSLSRKILDWAPDSRFCEVFLNGAYQGVYLAVEPVTTGDFRLNLSRFGLVSGQTPYVVKRDRAFTEENEINIPDSPIPGLSETRLSIDYPTPAKLTAIQADWISRDIRRIEERINSEDFADPQRGYRSVLDTEAFADYLIISEVTMNTDSGALSTYYYKDLQGKLKITVWDFNNAFDNNQWSIPDYEDFILDDRPWFQRLLQDRAFVDQVLVRYTELRQDVLSETSLMRAIDADVAELGVAVERNFAVWGYTFGSNLKEGPEPADYEDAVRGVKGALKKRLDFLDRHLIDLYKGTIN